MKIFNSIVFWHDRLKLRFKWYYLWHLNPHATKVHTIILCIYVLVIGLSTSLSILVSPSPQKVHATGQMQMASGTYAGNSVDNRAITGIGFQPDLVMVKSSAASDSWRAGWWRSSAIVGDISVSFYNEAQSGNKIQSLNDDGFTIGNDLWINQTGETYYWQAFKDNGGGDIKVGTYTGDGTDNRDVTGFGFQPDLILVKSTAGGTTNDSHYAYWKTSSHSGEQSQKMYNVATVLPDCIQSIGADGFQVGTVLNTNSVAFYYFAFKQIPGFMKVGTYIGDGTDNRDITGIGFQPDMVWAQNSVSNTYLSYKPALLPGDASLRLINSNITYANNIQAIQADGFQVGTGINGNTVTYIYVAWKNYAGISNNQIWDCGGGADTNWSTAANWSDDVVPTAGMSAIFSSTCSGNSTIDASFGGVINNITIGPGYTGTVNLGAQTLAISGDLTISSGTLNGSTGTINLSGDWNNTGTFAPGSSNVNLVGTTQQILGATTFNNLSKTVTSADTLKFASNATQTISGALTLIGTSGNLLSLQPSTASVAWSINPQGSRNISYVNVQYSNNTNAATITADDSTNSGNNANWSFVNHLTQALVGSGPYNLNASGSEYILDENLTLPGSGLVISGSDITLNLNNKTLAYNNTAVPDFPNYDFETADLSNWTFSNGTFERTSTASRPMMNDWYMKGTGIAASGDLITSDWISLPTANRTYIGGIIGSGDMIARVSIDTKANSDGTITTNAYSGSDTHLSNAHAPMASVQFKPGNVADYTFRLKITKISGAGTAASFDYAMIRPAFSVGVVIMQSGFADPLVFPDLPAYSGTNAGFIIKNGTITEGQSGIFSKGIAKTQASPGEILGVTINAIGVDSTNLSATTGVDTVTYPNEYVLIHDSTFNSTSPYVLIRDHLTGFPVMLGSHIRFYHNTIDGGQGGISAEGSTDVKIYENDAAHGGGIKIKQYVTNHYSVETYEATDIEIYNNDIATTDEGYWGRGIHIGEGSSNISTHDNTLSIRVRLNPEYPNPGNHGAHGIKIEGSDNAQVYNNTVTVYSDANTYAAALDLDVAGKTVSVHDNTFIAIGGDGYKPSDAIRVTDGGDYSGLTLENNSFISNDNMIEEAWPEAGAVTNWTLRNNTFACGTSISDRCSSLPDFFNSFHISNGATNANSNNVKIINPVVEGGLDFTSTSQIKIAGGAPAPNTWEYFVQYTLTANVTNASGTALAGATITASSSQGDITGTTNESGQVQLELTQARLSGISSTGSSANATDYNPYTLSVAKEGYNTSTQSISITSTTTLPTITLAEVLPAAPTIGAPTALSASIIRWNFTDNASDETGFKVYDGSNNLVATCVGANLTYCDETGLPANTEHSGRYVVAYNSAGNSSSSATASSVYTQGNIPSAPAVYSDTASSLKIVINANSNPASTLFAIENETSGRWMQADGSLGDSETWQTRSAWGSDSGTINTGLASNTAYTYRVKAKNGNNIETNFSDSAQKITGSSRPATIRAVALSTGSIKVDWASGGNQNRFNLYRKGQSGTTTLIHSSSNLSFTDSGLNAATRYTYYLYSVNTDGMENPDFLSATISTKAGAGSLDIANNSLTANDVLTSTFKIGADISDLIVEELINFDATMSGDNVRCEWDFGDGKSSNSPQVTHRYQKPGRYTVKLTVINKDGNKAEKTQTVDIKPSVPVISNIYAAGGNIIIEGKAFPETLVYLTFHSDIVNAEALADRQGKWRYTLTNASDSLGEGDHAVYAISAVKIANDSEIRGNQSKTYDFKVTVENGKLTVEMQKTKTWQLISLGLGLILLVALVLVLFKRKRAL